MLRIDILSFVTDWYISEVVRWGLVRLPCSHAIIFPVLFLFVNTSVNILYLLEVCVASSSGMHKRAWKNVVY